MAHPPTVTTIANAEIIPLKTITVPPYTTTNAVVYGSEKFVVIDPGSLDHDQQLFLLHHLSSRIERGQQMLAVLLTHHHGDHTKGALMLATHFCVPIRAHKNANTHLNFSITPIEDKEKLELSHQVVLEARYTPGHADDHMVYYDQGGGFLMAGDMITDRGTVLIPPMHGDLATYLQSLQMLTELQLTTIIPAHGNAITKEPQVFLLKALQHRFMRIHEVFMALAQCHEPQDATDITHHVYGSSIPDNIIVFAQLSVESSLHWLKKAGLAKMLNYKWQACVSEGREIAALVSPLKQIDERLRNA